MPLPTDPDARKALPIYSGVIKYFPHALAAVAQLSKIGNDQHNPGQPLHWAKEKSSDETDALLRHVVDMAIDPEHRDPDGVRAAVKTAWRALANLERLYDAGSDIFADESMGDDPWNEWGTHTCLMCATDFRTTSSEVKCKSCQKDYIERLNQ